MTFSVSARTTGWVAIGVSNDRRMVCYVCCRHIITISKLRLKPYTVSVKTEMPVDTFLIHGDSSSYL